MKPNVQLNHIISLAMDLGCRISIDGPLSEVSVFFKAESKTAKLDDRDGMNKIADWLSLAAGSDVEAKAYCMAWDESDSKAVGDIAEAKAEAAKAVKQQVDKPRINRGFVDITAPGVC